MEKDNSQEAVQLPLSPFQKFCVTLGCVLLMVGHYDDDWWQCHLFKTSANRNEQNECVYVDDDNCCNVANSNESDRPVTR